MPKLPPPPAQAPQQIAVGLDHDAIGGHQLSTAEVVARQPMLALQPADAAAQRQTGDARGRDQATGRAQPVGSRRRVEVRPGRTGLNDRPATFRGHLNSPQGSQIDDDTTLARRQAAHAVPARTHGKRHPGGPGQVHRSGDVGAAVTARDKRRLRRDGAVPHRPRLGVAVLTRHEYVSREAGAKRHSEGLLRRRHASSLQLNHLTIRVGQQPTERYAAGSHVRCVVTAQSGRSGDRELASPARPALTT